MLGKLEPRMIGWTRPKKKNRTRPITLMCKECGEEFNVCNYEKDTRKFCSRTCASRNYHRTTIVHTVKETACEYCGDKFTQKSYPRKPDKRYCCSDCANKHREILKREREIAQLEKDFQEVVNEVYNG